jgi:cytochrome c553
VARPGTRWQDNYAGFGRNASGCNVLYLFAWTALQARPAMGATGTVKLHAICASVAVVALTTAFGHAAQESVALDLVRRECSTCHGARGISIAPMFPHLAGQPAPYLEAQLKAFRDRSRADPHAQAFMWGMAAQLTDGMIAEMAAYFAAQSPPPGKPADPAKVAAGKKIYEDGIEAQNVPACESCHMKNAEGNAVSPRLAGQHRSYLEKQLEMFATGLRANPIMNENAKSLTALQVTQLSAFLSSR